MQTTPGDKLPHISVCIANYNGIDIIGPCLDSILNQQVDCEIEILIHDDASTDGSADFIKSKYPHVTLIESKKNIGYCKSNNLMAKNATGNYLLFLNNDVTLFSEALDVLYKYSKSCDKPHILSLPQFDMDSGEIIDYGNSLDLFLNPAANKSPDHNKIGMVIGALLWIPRLAWDEIGGFPEWFESLSEDMYLCMYALILGYNISVLHLSGYYHKVGHSFGGGKLINNKMITTFTRRRLSERNKCYVMFLFYPMLLFYVIFPIHVLLLFAEGLLLSIIKKNNKIFFNIYSPALSSIWKYKYFLAKNRKIIQSRRKIGYLKFLSVFTFMPVKLKMFLRHGIPTIR